MPNDPFLHSIQPGPDDPDTPRPVYPPVIDEDRLRALVSQNEGDEAAGCGTQTGCVLGLSCGLLLGLFAWMVVNTLDGFGQDGYSSFHSRSNFDELVSFLVCVVMGGALGALIGGAVFFFAGVLLAVLRLPFRG